MNEKLQAYLEFCKQDAHNADLLNVFVSKLLIKRKTINHSLTARNLLFYYNHCLGTQIPFDVFLGALCSEGFLLYEEPIWNTVYIALDNQSPILKLLHGRQLNKGNHKIRYAREVLGDRIFDPWYFHPEGSWQRKHFKFWGIWK